MNLSDINFKEAKMRVLGKGNKERMVYLNEACMDALHAYLQVREFLRALRKLLFS